MLYICFRIMRFFCVSMIRLNEFYSKKKNIFDKCIDGDVKTLEKLIEKEKLAGNEDCVNEVNEKGKTPLILACLHGNIEVVDKLIELGADINRIERVNGWTPLYAACVCGRVDIVKRLLENGANVNKGINNGFTPLQVVCWHRKVEIVDVLLDAGADVNKANYAGKTAIFFANQVSNIEVIKKLLSCEGIKKDKVAQEARDKINKRALGACKKGNVNEVEELLDIIEKVKAVGIKSLGEYFNKSSKGVKRYLIKRFGLKKTIEALKYMDRDATSYVIEKLSNKKEVICVAKGDIKDTLETKILDKLIIACDEADEFEVRELLDTGIDSNKVLSCIPILENENIERILKESMIARKDQFAVNYFKNKDREKLLSACENSDINKVGRVLEGMGTIGSKTLGKSFNVANREITKYLIDKVSIKETVEALQYVNNDEYIMDELVKRKNILNLVDGTLEKKISQKLVKACAQSDKDKVVQLLDTGIDVTKDETYMQVSLDKEIRKILREHGAKEVEIRVEIKRNEPRKVEKYTMLKLIVSGDASDKVMKMLDKGAYVDEVDKKRRCALMYAIRKGNVEIARKLVGRGANVELKDVEDKSVLMYALEQGDRMAFIIDDMINSVDTDMVDKDGKDLLMYACQGGYMKAVETLLKRKNELVYNVDNRGWTAVGIAFEREDINMTKYLFSKGATNPGEIKEKNKFYKLLGEVDTREEKQKKTRHKILVEKSERTSKKGKTKL
ncbi:MAG: ankyrin repeat domain-containing protein [Clostridiales bacterium]|nr:ankyrin repeat domain-containing protein [Clostridiales bacterium]